MNFVCMIEKAALLSLPKFSCIESHLKNILNELIFCVLLIKKINIMMEVF